MPYPGLRSTASRPDRPSKGSLIPARPLSDLVSKYETLSTGDKRPALLSEVKLRPTNPRDSGPTRPYNAATPRISRPPWAEPTKTLKSTNNQGTKLQLQVGSKDSTLRLQPPLKDAVPERSREQVSLTSVSERRKAFEALEAMSRPGSQHSPTTYRELDIINSPQRAPAREIGPIKTYRETSTSDYPKEIIPVLRYNSTSDKSTNAESAPNASHDIKSGNDVTVEEVMEIRNQEPDKDVIENGDPKRAPSISRAQEKEQSLPVAAQPSTTTEIPSPVHPVVVSRTGSELVSDIESSLNTPIFSDEEIEVLFSRLSAENSLLSHNGPGSLLLAHPSAAVIDSATTETVCNQGCCSAYQRRNKPSILRSDLSAWQDNSPCVLSPAERARYELNQNGANVRTGKRAEPQSVEGAPPVPEIIDVQSSRTPAKAGPVQPSRHIANGKQNFVDSTITRLRGSLRGWSDSWKSKAAPAQLNTPTARHASWCPSQVKDQLGPPGEEPPVPQADGTLEYSTTSETKSQRNSIWKSSRKAADQWLRVTPPKDIAGAENGHITPPRKTPRLNSRTLQLSSLFSINRLSRGSDSSTLIGHEEIVPLERHERDNSQEIRFTSRFGEPALYM